MHIPPAVLTFPFLDKRTREDPHEPSQADQLHGELLKDFVHGTVKLRAALVLRVLNHLGQPKTQGIGMWWESQQEEQLLNAQLTERSLRSSSQTRIIGINKFGLVSPQFSASALGHYGTAYKGRDLSHPKVFQRFHPF